MILKLLNDIVYGLVWLLTAPMNIPSLPDGVNGVLETSLEYIGTGIGIIGAYIDIGYLLALFGVIIAIDAGLLLYKLVMWVIKKIPVGVQ